MAHGPSCSAACAILPDQGSNLCPLHWQAYSQPLSRQGSPNSIFLWPPGFFHPQLGQKSSTINHHQPARGTETPPHQFQATAFYVGVNSLPTQANSSEVKVTFYFFSLEMSTCFPRIQQLVLKVLFISSSSPSRFSCKVET